MAKRQRTNEAGEAGEDDDKKSDSGKTQKPDAKADAKVEAKPEAAAPEARGAKPEPLPDIEPPAPKGEPWPDATPEPMRPVDAPARARVSTVAMPIVADVGKPPEMPKTTAPPPLALGAVENPTHMPGPRQIPAGDPEDPAPAPGRVPPGDSRSLRHQNNFALIYRVSTYVISRFGKLGTRGQWRVVEYPTSSAASHAYAKECSRFVSEGFSDYRD
ncbi:MAG: hypothetical protein ACM31C_20020 [Acidobacteriota bacterium]